MFTIRKHHGSMLNLVNNPETHSKISSKKLINEDKQSIHQTHIQSRASRILPKLKPPSKPSDTQSKISDNKKQQKNKVKQLSMAISKYYQNREQYLKKPFNELSYDIITILECFSQIENNFQEVFQLIHKDLMGFLFVMTSNEVMSKYGIKEGEMYKKVADDIDKIATKTLKQMHEKLVEVTEGKEEMETEFARQRQAWQERQKKLLQELEFLNKLSNRQYAAYLEEKVRQKEQRIEQLEQSQRQLILLRDDYQKEIRKQEKTIEHQLEETIKLKATIFDLKAAKEQTQKMMLKLRDRFDQLTLKMIGIKDVIDVVQNENDSIKTERAFLIKRAAVTFQELTPRPKYAKLIKFTEQQAQRKVKSTEQLTDLLLKKLGSQISEQKFREQLFEEKINKKQMHPKLQHVDKIREQTVGSLIKSKEELKNVSRITSNDGNF